ncbi:hypothetical protein L0152_07375 [bacterium]|nr:hypothetical protein [bacterium]
MKKQVESNYSRGDEKIIQECRQARDRVENLLPLVKDRIKVSDYRCLMLAAIVLRIITEFGLDREG